MSGLRNLSFVLGFAGLALATALIAWFGAGSVWHEIVNVGTAGFAAVCAWQMVLFAGLGLAWWIIVPGRGKWPLWLLIWARMVRDAAGNCLPFSQVGGLVFGVRVGIQHGMTWQLASASTTVDVTTELIAQLLLIAAGTVILGARSPDSPVTEPLAIGLVLAALGSIGFIWLQRGAAPLLRGLTGRILGVWKLDGASQIELLQAEMNRIYERPLPVVLAVLMHAVCWFGTGVASWIAFRLLGADLDLLGALGIEALLHAALALAVLVPGYAGVQEAAYVGIGALFGQSAEVALGVSLLRRARDLALGIPILLIWQASEFRQHRAASARSE